MYHGLSQKDKLMLIYSWTFKGKVDRDILGLGILCTGYRPTLFPEVNFVIVHGSCELGTSLSSNPLPVASR